MDDLVAATRRRVGAVPGSREHRLASVDIRHAVERLRTWDRPRTRVGATAHDGSDLLRLLTG
jgi:hypothetical protein